MVYNLGGVASRGPPCARIHGHTYACVSAEIKFFILLNFLGGGRSLL